MEYALIYSGKLIYALIYKTTFPFAKEIRF